MELKTNITIRYSQAIDRFIKIRVFSSGEIQQLLKDVNLTDKRSYQQLIINSCIVNYNDDILKDIMLFNQLKNKDAERLEGDLYQLCIKINPAIDINRVSISVEEPATHEYLFLLEGDHKRSSDRILGTLEENLKKRVVGQDEVIPKIVQALKRSYVGIKSPNRPDGVFLFAGQTGVGKTELAKTLAELVLGDVKNMVRIDCSEFALPHEYAKLIGAPPGYVGYDDGGILSEPLIKDPERIVLFDEIEKAHPKVHNLLLQIMDEGFATDNKGNRIPFNHSIIIMTSNVGAGEIAEHEGAMGFGNRKAEIQDNFRERETIRALEKIFAPEFLNRIDDIIVFKALAHEDNVKIVEMNLEHVRKRLETVGKKISFPARLKEHLASKIENSKFGARPLKRIINRYVENPLSDCLLNEEFKDSEKIRVSLKRGKLSFHPV